MFAGYVNLNGTLYLRFRVKNTSNQPVNADALPTWRVYDSSGVIDNNTVAESENDVISNVTGSSPLTVTSAGHGLSTGAYITVEGVEGETGANGSFTITKVDADSFTLDGSSTAGAYTSGGNWNTAGAYTVTIACTAGNGFEQGGVYTVFVDYEVSATQTSQEFRFVVT